MEVATPPLVDILLLTALTEEQQVVEQVLQLRASYRGQAGEPPERVNVYAYPPDADRPYHVATASIHQMGAVPMAAKAPRLLKAVRPEAAVLLGISATTVPGTIGLGDVPVASQVIEYDDIAAAQGEFTFRSDGYQVDPRLRDAAGALQADLGRYAAPSQAHVGRDGIAWLHAGCARAPCEGHCHQGYLRCWRCGKRGHREGHGRLLSRFRVLQLHTRRAPHPRAGSMATACVG